MPTTTLTALTQTVNEATKSITESISALSRLQRVAEVEKHRLMVAIRIARKGER